VELGGWLRVRFWEAGSAFGHAGPCQERVGVGVPAGPQQVAGGGRDWTRLAGGILEWPGWVEVRMTAVGGDLL